MVEHSVNVTVFFIKNLEFLLRRQSWKPLLNYWYVKVCYGETLVIMVELRGKCYCILYQESRISALEAKLKAALKLLVCKSILGRNRCFPGGAQW